MLLTCVWYTEVYDGTDVDYGVDDEAACNDAVDYDRDDDVDVMMLMMIIFFLLRKFDNSQGSNGEWTKYVIKQHTDMHAQSG